MVYKEIYKLIQFRGRESEMAYKKKYESRLDKTIEQAKKTVEVKEVVNHVNDFLEKVGVSIVNNPKFSYNGYIDYSKIMEDYNLNNIKHLVWIKFTIDGYVGVVEERMTVNT